MWNVPSLKVMAIVCAVAVPVVALAVTGRVLPNSTVGPKPATKKYGWVSIQYERHADAAYKTQWALVTSNGPTGYLDVTAPGATPTPRRLPAGKTYMVLFKKKDPAATFDLPESVTVAVVDQKVTTRYLRYDP